MKNKKWKKNEKKEEILKLKKRSLKNLMRKKGYMRTKKR
jgi:hypothetical protein